MHLRPTRTEPSFCRVLNSDRMKNVIVTVAHHPIRLQHSHDTIRRLVADFEGGEATAADSADLLTVAVTEADLATEREWLGVPASVGRLEALALERAVARALAPLGVCHMHAVAVAVDREAYVFLADSGVGKSTHAAAWLALLGDRAMIACDDKPFLSYTDGVLWIHGSPWKGKERWGMNVSLPVKAFCILHRGETDVIRPATGEEALMAFLRYAYMPEEPVGAAAVLSLADRALSAVPFWRMECTVSPAAAEVAYHTMSKLSKKE